MQFPRAILGSLVLAGCALVLTSPALAQGTPRPLAPGVLKTIPTELEPRDMSSLPMRLPGLQAPEYDPKTIPKEATLDGQSFRVILNRDHVWEYEFSFLGLRQARLKIPTASGEVENRNVWYLVYRVRDTGKTMSFKDVRPNPDSDYVKQELQFDQPIPAEEKKFLPRFTLEGWVPTGDRNYKKVAYRDVINPVLVEQIRNLEDPNQRLLDSHQMSQVTIPPASNDADPGVWGVAIWEDVNPRLDYVSVYVKGLTNAYRLARDIDAPAQLKTLQLNFWRPGDVIAEKRDDVVYGIPLVDDPQAQVMICQRYDLPGPVLRGYQYNDLAKRNVLVVEADAQISLEDFTSALTPSLDQGKLPPELVEAFAKSGIQLDPASRVLPSINGRKWVFSDGGKEYTLELDPRFWEPDFGKIRFIRTLDYMWIYR